MGFKSVGGQYRASQQRFSQASAKYNYDAFEGNIQRKETAARFKISKQKTASRRPNAVLEEELPQRRSSLSGKASSLSRHYAKASVEPTPADDMYQQTARETVRPQRVPQRQQPQSIQGVGLQSSKTMVLSPPSSPDRSPSPQRGIGRQPTVQQSGVIEVLSPPNRPDRSHSPQRGLGRSATAPQSRIQEVLFPANSPERRNSPDRALSRSATMVQPKFSEAPRSPQSRADSPWEGGLQRSKTASPRIGGLADPDEHKRQRPMARPNRATARTSRPDIRASVAGAARQTKSKRLWGSFESQWKSGEDFACLYTGFDPKNMESKDYGSKLADTTPVPTPQQGKFVRHDQESDSRGGTSLKAGIVVKEQEAPGCFVTARSATMDDGVKLNGFTDRFIRVQDGAAMKAIFSGRPGADGKASQHPPTCQCAVCKPLRSSLLPPAGQVCQVDVGNCGTPPYILQVESDGVMPMCDMVYGRTAFKQRPGSPPPILSRSEEQVAEKAFIPRGCEKLDPENPEQKSSQVKAAMNAQPAHPVEAENDIRKALGNKRIPEHVVHWRPTQIAFDDERPPQPRMTKSCSSRIRATHHWSVTGAPERQFHMPETPKSIDPGPDSIGSNASRPPGHSLLAGDQPKPRNRNPGEYNGTVSTDTAKLHLKSQPHLRYEDLHNPRGKNYSARIRATHHWSGTGSPSVTVHTPPFSTRPTTLSDSLQDSIGHSLRSRSESAPPPTGETVVADNAERAGIPSFTGTRPGFGKRMVDRPDHVNYTHRVIDHTGSKMSSQLHEVRMNTEDDYASRCEHTMTISRSAKQVSNEIKERTSLYGSTGVARCITSWANETCPPTA